MNNNTYLPLGSIVYIKGDLQKLMIISRGMVIANGNEQVLFDYGACMYPYGMINDKVAYFNHEDIAQVVHEGYSDSDDQAVLRTIQEALKKQNFNKGTAEMFKHGGPL